MLVISGSAQFIAASEQFTTDDLHNFTMFCNNDMLDEQLTDIEQHLNTLGWDNISIDEAELTSTKDDINHDVLKQAYSKAQHENFAVVIHNIPLNKAA